MTGQALFYMGREKSQAQNPCRLGGGRRQPRLLCAEAAAIGGRAENRLDRQRPGERKAHYARVHGRRPGDDLPHDHGAGGGRGAAESLHRSQRERGARADAGDPSYSARIAHLGRTLGTAGAEPDHPSASQRATAVASGCRGQQPHARRWRVSRLHDAHAARSHEAADLDRSHRPAASAPAAHQDATHATARRWSTSRPRQRM